MLRLALADHLAHDRVLAVNEEGRVGVDASVDDLGLTDGAARLLQGLCLGDADHEVGGVSTGHVGKALGELPADLAEALEELVPAALLLEATDIVLACVEEPLADHAVLLHHADAALLVDEHHSGARVLDDDLLVVQVGLDLLTGLLDRLPELDPEGRPPAGVDDAQAPLGGEPADEGAVEALRRQVVVLEELDAEVLLDVLAVHHTNPVRNSYPVLG